MAYNATTARDVSADPGEDATIHVDDGADSEIEAPSADLPDFLTEDALAVVNGPGSLTRCVAPLRRPRARGGLETG